MAKPPQTGLLSKLEGLRQPLSEAAQAVVDAWEQDEDGWDCDVGEGGICDRVSEAMSGVIGERIPEAEFADGGHDGDDHAWLIVYDSESAYGVDIPPGVYETGGGYSWRKIPGASISPEDVSIFEVDRTHVGSSGLYLRWPHMGEPSPDVIEAAARQVAAQGAESPRIARKKGRRRDTEDSVQSMEEDMLVPATEYSCQVELSISTDFEGEVEKQRLVKKLKDELSASIRAAMGIVARDLGISSTGVRVRPVKVQCAMNSR